MRPTRKTGSRWIVGILLGMSSVAWAQEGFLLPAQEQALKEITQTTRAAEAVAFPSARRKQACTEHPVRPRCVPIAAWETAVITMKDSKTGQMRSEEIRYPVFDLAGIAQPMGDNSLCWEVCKDACDGYGVCHAFCWTKCASQGGPGDPRPR